MATERFKRQYGGLPRLAPSGAAQAYGQIRSALAGFTSAAGTAAIQGLQQQSLAQAEEQALAYDPTSGAPVLSERQNKAAKAYNRQVLQAHQQEVDYTVRAGLDSIATQHADNPTTYQAAANAYLKEAAKDMHPALQQQMLPRFNYQRDTALGKITTAEQQRQLERTKQVGVDWAKSSIEEIAKIARVGDVQEVEERIALFNGYLDEMESLNDDEKAVVRSQMVKEVYTAGFVSDISERGTVEALSKLDEMRNDVPNLFTRDEWDEIISSEITRTNSRIAINNKKEAEFRANNEKLASNLEITIDSLEEPDVEVILQAQKSIEELYDNNVIPAAKRTSLHKQLNTKIESQRKEYNNLQDFVKVLGGDTSVLPSSLEDMDKSYESWVKTLEPEFRNAQIEKAVGKLQQVPKPLKMEITNGLASGDEGQTLSAVDLVNRIGKNPRIDLNISKEEVAFAKLVERNLMSMSFTDAIERANNLVYSDNPEYIRANEAKYKDATKKTDWNVESRNDFSGYFAGKVDKYNEPALAADYEARTKDYYVLNGGNMELAKESAQDDMNRFWGKHDGRLVRNPPQNFYGMDDENDWIQDQVEAEANPDGLYSNVFLMSDDRTMREVSNSAPPTYSVYVVDEQGQLMPLNKRFIPDQQAELDRREIVAADKQEQERRKAVFKMKVQEQRKESKRKKLEKVSEQQMSYIRKVRGIDGSR